MLLLFVVDTCITVEESLNNLVISWFMDYSSIQIAHGKDSTRSVPRYLSVGTVVFDSRY